MSFRAGETTARAARILALLFLGAFLTATTGAQENSEPEISTKESTPTFTIRTRTNEVPVRVVVRDSEGNAVPNLTKDDFKLFDDGKPQIIGNFVVERLHPLQEPAKGATANGKSGETAAKIEAPTRFVAFYIDDTFMKFNEIVRTRDATRRYLHTAFAAGDRLALYTSSGSQTVNFTNDPQEFEEALSKLAPHPAVANNASECPRISEYEAYLISEKEDMSALQLGVARALKCMCQVLQLPPQAQTTQTFTTCGDKTTVEETVKMHAREIWQRAQLPMQRTLQGIQNVIRKMRAMPGQRSIVWITPGFVGIEQQAQLSNLADQALRARVVINALDSRGLWAMVPGNAASEQGSDLSGRYAGLADSYARAVQQIDTGVMEEAAAATGGVFVGNTNDYDGGLRRVGSLPEVAYLLSFSPPHVKSDGKFHNLRVELVNHCGLTVQARKGYFAPSVEATAEAQAKKEIDDAVFTNEERNDFPVRVQTQFFKTGPLESRLTVLARVDMRGARLQKVEERHVGEIRFVTALFDQNGNYLEGKARVIGLRVKDATLQKLLAYGLRTEWQFNVKPGTYVVREVVRDSSSGGIAALTRTVEIPYP